MPTICSVCIQNMPSGQDLNEKKILMSTVTELL